MNQWEESCCYSKNIEYTFSLYSKETIIFFYKNIKAAIYMKVILCVLCVCFKSSSCYWLAEQSLLCCEWIYERVRERAAHFIHEHKLHKTNTQEKKETWYIQHKQRTRRTHKHFFYNKTQIFNIILFFKWETWIWLWQDTSQATIWDYS